MTIVIKAIREDLGEGVALLECSCPWEFLVNLKKEMPGYNPQTGRVRCPRCANEMSATDIFRTLATINGDRVTERIAQMQDETKTGEEQT